MNIVFIWHFFSSYHGLLSRRPIKSTAIPGNIDIRIKTKDAFKAAKICKNGTYKVFDEWVQSSFSKFLSLMPDVSLIRYTTINNGIKESASWFHLKLMLVITDSIKVNKSCTPSELSMVDLNSEVCENKSITFSFSEPIWLPTIKEPWKLKQFF